MGRSGICGRVNGGGRKEGDGARGGKFRKEVMRGAVKMESGGSDGQ